MKTYKPTQLYFLKIFGLIVCATASIFIVSLLSEVIRFFVDSPIFGQIVVICIIIASIIAAFLIIRSNNPTITFQNKFFTIGGLPIEYDQIKGYYPSKGGSEPYITTKNGNKIDLELSWFTKKDRIEIENTLYEKIKPYKMNGELSGFTFEKIAIPNTKDEKKS